MTPRGCEGQLAAVAAGVAEQRGQALALNIHSELVDMRSTCLARERAVSPARSGSRGWGAHAAGGSHSTVG